MPHTIYVVQGFRGGCRAITQCFKSEALARKRAAYLGGSFDGVVMWRHTADPDPDIGNHDGPSAFGKNAPQPDSF